MPSQENNSGGSSSSKKGDSDSSTPALSASSASTTEPAATPAAPPASPEAVALSDIRYQIALVERSVASKESRYATRVLRGIATLRKKLTKKVVKALLENFLPVGSSTKTVLLTALEAVPGEAEPMDVETVAAATESAISTANSSDDKADATAPMVTDTTAPTTAAPKKPVAPPQIIHPEVDVYVHLLTVIYLIDSKCYSTAKDVSADLITKVQKHNRRTLDQLAAKCFFYFMRAHELSGDATDVRPLLHAALRTATLHRDNEGQATLINLLLRDYLQHSLYEQADKLIAKSTFPEAASNNEWARYFYYLGRIRAIQLEYSKAYEHLQQAIRKAPQLSAPGFQQTVHKLAVTVQLLLGEIPERSTFRQPVLKHCLAPYFQLTQAVRVGNLGQFADVLERFGDKFREDKNYTLILRLRHSVIKTGVRMIDLSYSKISTQDIAAKLQLENASDAEYIVAKAIRDGVIDAALDYDTHVMESKELVNIYNSTEPLEAFNQRINFCLNIHNECVKALRFPPNAHRKGLETAEQRREREQQEKELAEEMADEED